MPVYVNWDNLANTAIRLSFVAPWTWAEYEFQSRKIDSFISSVEHSVDLIIDLRLCGEIPDFALAHLAESYSDSTANLRQYILVGVPDDFQEKFKAADRYYTALGGNLHFVFVDSLNQARLLNYTP